MVVDHILFAQSDLQSPGALCSLAELKTAFRISLARSGGETADIIARDKPKGVLADFYLPDVSGVEVAWHALSLGIPTILRAQEESSLAMLEASELPYLVEPLREQEVLTALRLLITSTVRGKERLRQSLRRLQIVHLQTRNEKPHTVQELRMHEQAERMRRSGASTRKTRKASPLDDWDIVRAAQHMIETHGENAIRIAKARAAASQDAGVEECWDAIGQAVLLIRGAG